MTRSILFAAALLLLLGACAQVPTVPEAARAELAPKGAMRVAINLSNVMLTTRDRNTGDLSGVTIDLSRELARRLGVTIEFITYPSPGAITDSVDKDAWDVSFLAIEASRAEKIAFSPPITQIEAGYLVPPGSRVASIADIDRPGVRIAVAEKTGYDLYLTKALQSATLVRGKGRAGTFELLQREKLDAMADLKPQLMELQPKLAGSRVLDGRFMTVQHGLVVPVRRRAAAEYLRGFAADAVRSGLVARSIERHAVKGLSAAASP